VSEYDTSALLEDLKERGSLPDEDFRFSDILLLNAATREMREGIAPMLTASRLDYLVYAYTVAVTSGKASYRMPTKAVGGTLRDVVFIGADGNPCPLTLLSSDEVRTIGNPATLGTPMGYYLRNYEVVLVPPPNVTGTLSMPYYARPNRLVLAGASTVTGARAIACATASYNTVAGSLQMSFHDGDPPAVLDGQGAGTQALEIVRASPGFETLLTVADGEPTIIEVAPNSWAYRFTGFTSNPGIVGGDYICLPGESPVPQLPVELFGLLAVRGARRALKAVGDDRWQALEADVAELESKAKDWLTSRVSGDTKQAGGQVAGSGLVAGVGFGGGWL
jgi:hypothetical protein